MAGSWFRYKVYQIPASAGR